MLSLLNIDKIIIDFEIIQGSRGVYIIGVKMSEDEKNRRRALVEFLVIIAVMMIGAIIFGVSFSHMIVFG